MLVTYSSAVADIATEQGADVDENLDPIIRMMRAEEAASVEYNLVDSTLTRSEFVQTNRHFYF